MATQPGSVRLLTTPLRVPAECKDCGRSRVAGRRNSFPDSACPQDSGPPTIATISGGRDSDAIFYARMARGVAAVITDMCWVEIRRPPQLIHRSQAFCLPPQPATSDTRVMEPNPYKASKVANASAQQLLSSIEWLHLTPATP